MKPGCVLATLGVSSQPSHAALTPMMVGVVRMMAVMGSNSHERLI
jgi:hypothetical protein